ncbi:MAG: hypothetical protein JOZ07_05735 [Solirubrobacterales bacterium]|nr:hypothetical protein [Solirubrobacterales bacterium]
MDDAYAQFMIAIVELCLSADLAGLRVEVLTTGGLQIEGVPTSIRQAEDEGQVDSTGYARTFRINDALVNLDDITQCTIHAPALRA